MTDEKDLASPNYRSTVSGAVGATMMAQAAQKSSGWLRYLMYAFAAIAALATIAGLVGKVSGVGSIPACDAQTTRDTLSDLNKQNKFNATKYNFIKETAKSDAEVTCTANLALREGGQVEYDYRIYKDAGAVKVQITQVRR